MTVFGMAKPKYYKNKTKPPFRYAYDTQSVTLLFWK